MTENMIPAHLIGAERRTYLAGADKARVAFRKRTGANVLQTIGERREWLAVHGTTMASKAEAAGMAAVRKMHTARVVTLETATDAGRIGGPADGEHLAILTREAEYAAERLAILSPVKAPRVRKSAARKIASVPDVVAVESVDVVAPAAEVGRVTVTTVGRDGKVRKSRKLSPADCAPVAALVTCPECGTVNESGEMCEQCARPAMPDDAPADVVTAPETVPAPMPRMTRAARKATRRELAASMRAAGIRPEGDAWREACAAAGLVAPADVSASA